MNSEALNISIAIKRAMLPKLHMFVTVESSNQEKGLDGHALAPLVTEALKEVGLPENVATKVTIRGQMEQKVQIEFVGQSQVLLPMCVVVFNALNIGDESQLVPFGVSLGRALRDVRAGKAEEVSSSYQGSLPNRSSEESGVETRLVPGGIN